MAQLSTPVSTRLTRIGNSKGIIVPAVVVKSLALDEGDVVELEYDELAQILKCRFPHTKQLKLLSND